MTTASRNMVVAVGAITAAALASLVVESFPAQPARSRTAEFQQLTRGLGLGAESQLGRCPLAMDSRLDDQCAYAVGPIPGAECLCPCHAFSVLQTKPAPADVHLEFAKQADGPRP